MENRELKSLAEFDNAVAQLRQRMLDDSQQWTATLVKGNGDKRSLLLEISPKPVDQPPAAHAASDSPDASDHVEAT